MTHLSHTLPCEHYASPMSSAYTESAKFTLKKRRITKELEDLFQVKDELGIVVEAVDAYRLTHLRGYIAGSLGTPYDRGTFIVDNRIPDSYPFVAPVMKFDTPIWHPNINSQSVRRFLPLSILDLEPRMTSVVCHSIDRDYESAKR